MLFSHFTYFKSFDTEYCSAFANWQHSIDPRVVSDSSGRQLPRDGSRGREARDPSRRCLAPPSMAAGNMPPCCPTHHPPSTNPSALSTSRWRASSAPTAASTATAGGAPLPCRSAHLLPGQRQQTLTQLQRQPGSAEGSAVAWARDPSLVRFCVLVVWAYHLQHK